MIIAYASTNSDPKNNPSVDGTVAQADLATTKTLQLYAAGEDSEDANATLVPSWHLIKPSGSLASIDANNVLQSIDTWGNYLCFLIMVKTVGGQSTYSERDPLLAPASAFVTIRVPSTGLSLQKPAKGSREWQTRAYEWVTALEGMSGHDSRISALENATPVNKRNYTAYTEASLEGNKIGILTPPASPTHSICVLWFKNRSDSKFYIERVNVTLSHSGVIPSGEQDYSFSLLLFNGKGNYDSWYTFSNNGTNNFIFGTSTYTITGYSRVGDNQPGFAENNWTVAHPIVDEDGYFGVRVDTAPDPTQSGVGLAKGLTVSIDGFSYV